jgi:hypothetical protein
VVVVVVVVVLPLKRLLKEAALEKARMGERRVGH